MKRDAIVVGGGFFGCSLALMLQERGLDVLLVEESGRLLSRASYHNQARVHGGYHYPRSLMTALRSRINYPRFLDDYAGCVCDSFDQIYGVGRIASKVTADQYETFMGRVGAPLQPAPGRLAGLFNPNLVEKIWLTAETAFDAVKLAHLVAERLERAGIETWFSSVVENVEQPGEGRNQFIAQIQREKAQERIACVWVFDCTYSRLNRLRRRAGFSPIPLKHELTEMALVEVPRPLREVGITLMCGPFFSLMPFPARGLYTLSHVRYTPHHEWLDRGGASYQDPYAHIERIAKRSNFPFMQRDAARYVPAVAQCRQLDSLWEIKTLLPQSELDDGRPILFNRAVEAPNFISVMGGKIDNVYDLPEELDQLHLS